MMAPAKCSFLLARRRCNMRNRLRTFLLLLPLVHCTDQPAPKGPSVDHLKVVKALKALSQGDPRCIYNPLCDFDGLCAWDGAQCVATKRGCEHVAPYTERRREVTSQRGCRLRANALADCTARPTVKNSMCALLGECTVIDGYCMPGKDQHCKASWACRVLGRCHFDPQARRCVAKTPADCRNSQACAGLSQCVVDDGRCVVGTDADCRRAPRCKTDGLCVAFGNHCIPGTEADCQQSAQCAQSGLCHLENSRCVATSEADCKASRGCQAWGACQLKRGMCMPPEEN